MFILINIQKSKYVSNIKMLYCNRTEVSKSIGVIRLVQLKSVICHHCHFLDKVSTICL